MNTQQQNEPRAVVITGAGSGIGAACALSLDRLGWRVFAGVHHSEEGDALTQHASDRLTPLVLDVTDATSMTTAVQAVTTALGEGRLAGLINSAGVVMVGPLECLPPDKLHTQFAVNVVGLITVTQAFLPLLRRSQGRIVLMGSLAGKLALPFMGPYAASKFAVQALADAWRAELLPWQIHVSLIEPDAIATPIWTKIASRARANITPTLPPALFSYRKKEQSHENSHSDSGAWNLCHRNRWLCDCWDLA